MPDPTPTPTTAPAPTPSPAPAPAPSPSPTPSPSPSPTPTPSPAPTDWRKDIAGDNADWMNTLSRFASPKAMFESYQALRSKMSSGELKDVRPLPDKGTPEEQAAWRKEQGLPDKPEGYDLKIDGLELGEDEIKGLAPLLTFAHAANYRPEQVKGLVKWMADQRDAQLDAREEADKKIATATIDAMRAEWGGDYRTNMNGIQALLDTAPAGVKEKMMNGRLADGTPLMSDPDTLRFLTGLYRQINPVSTIVPAGDEKTMATTIDSELESIRKVMRENRQAYNRDQKMQDRYRELLGAKQRLEKKAA